MKTIRCIPVMALAALLSSCSLFGGMKAPTFSKEGEEVTYEEFEEALDEALEYCEFHDEESNLGDRVIKASISQMTTDIWKRGKKEISKTEMQATDTGESQFDYSNYVAKSTDEIKDSEKNTNQEGESTRTNNINYENYYQFGTINSSYYLILVNAKTKEYYGLSQTSSNAKDFMFGNLIRSTFSYAYYSFSKYMPSSPLTAKDYLFFNNNDTVFTYSENKEDEDKNSSFFNRSTKTKIKAQVDLTNKKQAIRLSYEYKEETEYKRDYEGYKDGDIVTSEEKYYVDYSFTAKEVTVNAVDLGNYTLRQ